MVYISVALEGAPHSYYSDGYDQICSGAGGDVSAGELDGNETVIVKIDGFNDFSDVKIAVYFY